MKRFLALGLMLIVLIGFGSSVGSFAVAKQTEAEPKTDALCARLEHMLYLNYNFDKDFKDDAKILENAMIALSDKADNDGFIARDTVLNFINNMYGYTVDETALDYLNLPQKPGCFFVIPKGYTKYSYTITKLSEYDGGVIAECKVLASSHDDGNTTFNITVDFTANNESCFGYNIASCAINRDLGYRL